MSYQKVTGPLMANSHPGSYCGQDAYSDMFVTEKRHANELGWHSGLTYTDAEQCRGVRECLIKKTLMRLYKR